MFTKFEETVYCELFLYQIYILVSEFVRAETIRLKFNLLRIWETDRILQL